MRGCAGAGSTQARTLTCRSPPPLALHPCLDLYGFRVLSNSDRAPVFLFVLCTRSPCPGTCLDQAGARFGLTLASGCLCLLKESLDLSRLDPNGALHVGARFGLSLAPGCSCLLIFSLPSARTRRLQGLDLGLEGGVVQTGRQFAFGVARGL